MLKQDEIYKIFSTVETLHSVSNTLSISFQQEMEKWPAVDVVKCFTPIVILSIRFTFVDPSSQLLLSIRQQLSRIYGNSRTQLSKQCSIRIFCSSNLKTLLLTQENTNASSLW